MAEGRSAARRVLQLKRRLGGAQEPAQIIKTLKVLQDLDISLDILVETGIGKTVKGFRKHADVGSVAKTLIKQWKELIPPEKKSDHRGRKQNTGKEKDETKSSVSKEIEPSEKSRASVLASRSSSSALISKKLNKQCTCSKKTCPSRDSESQKGGDNKDCSSSGSRRSSQGTNPKAKESDIKDRPSTDSKKSSKKQRSSVANKNLPALKEKPSKDASKQTDPKHVKKPEQKIVIKSKAESSSDEEFEPPTVSFESYLNYDQVAKKRKRKACSTGEQPKKCSEPNSLLPQKTSKFSHAKWGEEDGKKCEGDQSENYNKKAKVASLQDLLNTPLPKFLTGISISSPPYTTDFEAPLAPVVEAPQQLSETAQFTGQRLNSKMQVYSGSKAVSLSKMLTLYEQCIRVLQNNIDLLHEVGGVPFEILEPVLTRCTPEQLLRIEKCNPVNSALLTSGKHGGHEASVSAFLTPFLIKTFTEESDHLWKRHCQRDFKNESLLEHEPWREMYLRLFNQREEKLKRLTENIISAQSKQPKGRQVKMAYVTGTVKPPRNICRQQEIHGTAGPVTQLHPVRRCKEMIPESRARNNIPSNPVSASNSGSFSSHAMTQQGKKPVKKIAPIMKKILKMLKSRSGRP